MSLLASLHISLYPFSLVYFTCTTQLTIVCNCYLSCSQLFICLGNWPVFSMGLLLFIIVVIVMMVKAK